MTPTQFEALEKWVKMEAKLAVAVALTFGGPNERVRRFKERTEQQRQITRDLLT